MRLGYTMTTPTCIICLMKSGDLVKESLPYASSLRISYPFHTCNVVEHTAYMNCVLHPRTRVDEINFVPFIHVMNDGPYHVDIKRKGF